MRKNDPQKNQPSITFDEDNDETTDYVFRILANFEKPDTISKFSLCRKLLGD